MRVSVWWLRVYFWLNCHFKFTVKLQNYFLLSICQTCHRLQTGAIVLLKMDCEFTHSDTLRQSLWSSECFSIPPTGWLTDLEHRGSIHSVLFLDAEFWACPHTSSHVHDVIAAYCWTWKLLISLEYLLQSALFESIMYRIHAVSVAQSC